MEAQKKADVVTAQIETLGNVDSLADTPFSSLFHEARTSTPDTMRSNGYTGVSVQARVNDDGEIETSDVVKTRQGESLRGTDSWDFTLSLQVRPFMALDVARDELIWQLRKMSQTYSSRAHRNQQIA